MKKLGRKIMGKTQKSMKTMSGHGFTSFELTKNLLNNLQQFNITPTAKLVLLYLSSCYNPQKASMFPKQKTIADKIGVSERSVTRAVQELFKAGLIIIECNLSNRYKFTSKIVSECPQNEKNFYSENLSGIDDKISSQDDKLSGTCIEQIKEHKKEPTYVEDFKILKHYAVKHGAKNVNAYIKVLRKNGADKRIIQEYKEKLSTENYWHNQAQKTSKLVEEYKNFEGDEPSERFKALKKKLIKSVNFVNSEL